MQHSVAAFLFPLASKTLLGILKRKKSRIKQVRVRFSYKYCQNQADPGPLWMVEVSSFFNH